MKIYLNRIVFASIVYDLCNGHREHSAYSSNQVVFFQTCVFLRLIRCDITTFFISTHFTFNIINLSFLTDTWNLSTTVLCRWTNIYNSAWVWVKVEICWFFSVIQFEFHWRTEKNNWESEKNSNSNKFTSKHRIDFIGTAWDNFIGINKIHDAHNIDSCIISEFGLLKGGASYRGAWNLQKCTPIDLFLFGFSWLFHKTSTHFLYFFFDEFAFEANNSTEKIQIIQNNIQCCANHLIQFLLLRAILFCIINLYGHLYSYRCVHL